MIVYHFDGQRSETKSSNFERRNHSLYVQVFIESVLLLLKSINV